ncbi:MAG: isoleucine--tRNA ligase [Bacteroidia bacterium]|jgi:isoleucyl-tRNA synthetase|nr:isoleucine--tRNA ligase [Bacteroidia bacterium]
MTKYKEYKKLDFPAFEAEILKFWEANGIFEKSVSNREGAPSFVFYEGPPSANGMPGIHHVMARTVKDIFCRYQTLNGKQVKRKAGWDTHGLPVELQVEKMLGITKDDIGKKISVAEYNEACRKDVMKYTDVWNELTRKMGYWVDLSDPYITYENKYIESLWWVLKQLYNKGFLYKGYTIQPYSPAAGTGLSSHELNQPGTYKDVKDMTAVAMFKAIDTNIAGVNEDVFFLAWTTTPWTLPSNTALAVGEKITYAVVKTFNQYSHQPCTIILAKALMGKYFAAENAELGLNTYKAGDKKIPFQIVAELTGKDLAGMRYEQLLPFAKVENGDAFKVIVGDFVTTEDGTGIVHIAPSFGADDFRVAKQNGIGSLTLVDKRGKFLPEVQDGQFLYGEEYVKEAYLTEQEKATALAKQKEKLTGIIHDTSKLNYLSVDERIVLKLQTENKLFKKEKYDHTYPHCWRTDKPILYYPLESWFIKTTAVKDKLIANNKAINWKPEHTGTGRFGNWLENLVDWNLSRSRYWGTPLPIWRTVDGNEQKCIGSQAELKAEIDKSIAAGLMDSNAAYKNAKGEIELHKPYVDNIVLVSSTGAPMLREPDLIDVWFDSGAMPYAQWAFPFGENEVFSKNYPADFIAEGVDQTRGWFFTLHALAVLLSECSDEIKAVNAQVNNPGIAFKNVIANGLVLDKNGNKMSKRLGNVVDPFEAMAKYGADANRWYMLSNSDPWDNLKFDIEGVAESQRKFFGTLYNTYSFFAIYANIDGFEFDAQNLTPVAERTELDRWIMSKLNSLVKLVREKMDDYDATPSVRAIEEFTGDHFSNWFIRLSRRRFWKGEMNADKKAAYETLYQCLITISQLSSPFAPFFSDWIYQNLKGKMVSVHLTDLPMYNERLIDSVLEEQMEYAQKISSLVLSIRKKENIKVRQPLQKMLIPMVDPRIKDEIKHVQNLILSEVNVKELEFIAEIEKTVKPNFRVLGKKVGAKMKAVGDAITQLNASQIHELEQNGKINLDIEAERVEILSTDVEILTADIAGYKVANDGKVTVALDVEISDSLRQEGIARELVSKLQNLRKEQNFEVTDRIQVQIQKHNYIENSIIGFKTYICTEILASDLEIVESINSGAAIEVDEHQIEVKLFKN